MRRTLIAFFKQLFHKKTKPTVGIFPPPPKGYAEKLLNAIVQEKLRCEEQCIKQVLRELLNREPTIDDAKQCSKIHFSNNGGYRLFYKQIEIGMIRYIDTPTQFRVEFVAVQKQN